MPKEAEPEPEPESRPNWHTDVCVYLTLSSPTLTAGAIPEYLGLECSQAIAIGDKRIGRLLHEQNAWLLDSGLSPREEEEVHLEALLARMVGKKELLRRLIAEHGVEAYVKIHSVATHGLNVLISRSALQRMADIGLELVVDCDIVDLSFFEDD